MLDLNSENRLWPTTTRRDGGWVRRMQGELLLAKARQEVLMVAEVQRQAEFVATT